MKSLLYVLVLCFVLCQQKHTNGVDMPNVDSESSQFTTVQNDAETGLVGSVTTDEPMSYTMGNETDNTTTDPGESSQNNTTPVIADEEHPYYAISHMMFVIVSPVIALAGLVNNGLMLAVMQRPNQKGLSVSIFMSALAVADSLVLILDVINNWINFISGVHLKSRSFEFCLFHNYLFHTMYTYSAWLVVCVSIERLVVVWYPLQAKVICTAHRSIIVVCVIPVLCAVLHSYNFLIWEISKDGRCDLDADYSYFSWYIYPWLNAVVYSYLPVVILICTNSAIIIKLVKAGSKRKTLGVEKQETMRITLTIVVICISYIILTVPLTLFYAIVFALGQFTVREPGMELARTIILIMGLSNHAINLFLYVITSAKIRHEIADMMRCRTVAKPATSVSQGNVSVISGAPSTAVTTATPSAAL